jgi:hypothetical protein
MTLRLFQVVFRRYLLVVNRLSFQYHRIRQLYRVSSLQQNQVVDQAVSLQVNRHINLL